MFRPRHEVSTKAALYNQAGTHVVLMQYVGRRNGNVFYGLPGGHVEYRETPDEALERELLEEIGLAVPGIVRRDFFRAGDNVRIILAYTGILPDDTVIEVPNPIEGEGKWFTKEELLALEKLGDDYRQFILAYWPEETATISV